MMVTAQMPLEKAREAVRNGSAYVITEQAIGALKRPASRQRKAAPQDGKANPLMDAIHRLNDGIDLAPLHISGFNNRDRAALTAHYNRLRSAADAAGLDSTPQWHAITQAWQMLVDAWTTPHERDQDNVSKELRSLAAAARNLASVVERKGRPVSAAVPTRARATRKGRVLKPRA